MSRNKKEKEGAAEQVTIEEENIAKLREELITDIESIREDRRKLEEERNTFREEMRKELEKNLQIEENRELVV